MACILIAEDDLTSGAYLSSLLSELEHDVVAASDGEEALQQLRAAACDLAIVDVMMPKLNGFDVVRALRADPKLKTMPVVLITAMNREGDRSWALKQGADEYLIKPVSLEDLRRVLEQHLPSG
ncbi:MAG: response regulator [Deltaproteobacteria bacterium]|nr:response regulator [Deltaproteobacteria bacterium]